MKTALQIVGILFGLLLILAAVFNWPVVVWGRRDDPANPPPNRPTVGSNGRRMPPVVRVIVGLIGAAFVVLRIVSIARSH